MNPITAKEVRYIKLGEKGRWADRCLERGELAFEYPFVPHDFCVARDWTAVRRLLSLVEVKGKKRGNPNDDLREIEAFYTLGADCLWITFAKGHLWWTFAGSEVTWLGSAEEAGPARVRKTIDGWRNTTITGEPLRIDGLSSRLTQAAGYRKTICEVEVPDYAIRRINNEEDPVVRRAQEIRTAMTAAAAKMITNLHWADFETLVDLIFTRSGWRRVSRVGGPQKDVDLILKQSTIDETAFVQVKSKAGQAVLDDYVDRFRQGGIYDRMFFVCHAPRGRLAATDVKPIHVWTGDRLADATIGAGLFDWLIERSM